MSRRIVVIGSGFGGLAIAVRLAANGHDVTLIDKRDKPGGRAYVYEQDGFSFDGGPTVTALTDQVRSIREATEEKVAEIGGDPGKTKVLLAAGRLRDFRCVRAEVRRVGRKGIAISPEAAELLEIDEGAKVLMVSR